MTAVIILVGMEMGGGEFGVLGSGRERLAVMVGVGGSESGNGSGVGNMKVDGHGGNSDGGEGGGRRRYGGSGFVVGGRGWM